MRWKTACACTHESRFGCGGLEVWGWRVDESRYEPVAAHGNAPSAPPPVPPTKESMNQTTHPQRHRMPCRGTCFVRYHDPSKRRPGGSCRVGGCPMPSRRQRHVVNDWVSTEPNAGFRTCGSGLALHAAGSAVRILTSIQPTAAEVRHGEYTDTLRHERRPHGDDC